MSKLKYIKFDQMMASIESDISNFADNGMINRGVAIKVVRKVNEDLGLKLNKEKQTIVNIANYKADLPEDFLFLESAFALTTEHAHTLPEILGTQTIELQSTAYPNSNTILPEGNEISVRPVNVFKNDWGSCELNECNGTYWVAQIFKTKTIKYENLIPLKLTRRSIPFCTDDCLNLKVSKCAYDIDFQNGQIVTGFREGKIYISYLSDMTDEEGNILILDHPLLTEYYEYAVKKHLLENYYLNNEADVVQRLQYINGQLREARMRALNFINTVEYSQIQEFYKVNRRRFYNTYSKMFDNPWYSTYGILH